MMQYVLFGILFGMLCVVLWKFEEIKSDNAIYRKMLSDDAKFIGGILTSWSNTNKKLEETLQITEKLLSLLKGDDHT